MGSQKSELKERIALERNELSNSLNELEMRAKAVTDWRARFASHPGAMLAVAFGGGLLLSGVLSGTGRSNGHAVDEAEYDEDEDVDEDDDAEFEDDPEDYDDSYAPEIVHSTRRRRRTSRLWDEISGAVMGLAAAKAIGLLDGIVPGLQAEMDDQRGRRRRR
jgi:hypothetical protein